LTIPIPSRERERDQEQNGQARQQEGRHRAPAEDAERRRGGRGPVPRVQRLPGERGAQRRAGALRRAALRGEERGDDRQAAQHRRQEEAQPEDGARPGRVRREHKYSPLLVGLLQARPSNRLLFKRPEATRPPCTRSGPSSF